MSGHRNPLRSVLILRDDKENHQPEGWGVANILNKQRNS